MSFTNIAGIAKSLWLFINIAGNFTHLQTLCMV